MLKSHPNRQYITILMRTCLLRLLLPFCNCDYFAINFTIHVDSTLNGIESVIFQFYLKDSTLH